MKLLYFDHAATTKVNENVLREMIPYLSNEYGNPSSAYGLGRSAKRAIETARQKVAKLIGAKPNEIYFTSCGSESDNTALRGIAYAHKSKGNHIITSKIEHHAILETCKSLEQEGFSITYLNVDENGFININELINSITPQTILISIMFANNEIGTIQPITKISNIAKKHNIVFHTDAVQAVGNVKIDVDSMGIDLLSLSGHKIYAPKGVGALYVKNGIEFSRFIDGGHQERNKRAGTENVASIVGLGKACELCMDNFDINYSKNLWLRNYFFEQLGKHITDFKINGSLENRLPGNCNIAFKNINASNLLLKLDSMGICTSAGSACSTGTPSPSHVLLAIGLSPELAFGTLRVTFGVENTREDVDFLIKALIVSVNELRNSN